MVIMDLLSYQLSNLLKFEDTNLNVASFIIMHTLSSSQRIQNTMNQ